VQRRTLLRHHQDKPGDDEGLTRRALPIGMAGSSPAMTGEGGVQSCNPDAQHPQDFPSQGNKRARLLAGLFRENLFESID
jgi:hypothetical protein